MSWAMHWGKVFVHCLTRSFNKGFSVPRPAWQSAKVWNTRLFTYSQNVCLLNT